MSASVEPAYLRLHRSGALKAKAASARRHLADCDLCAHACHVNRLTGITGAVCRTGEKAVVSSFGPHFGEEAPLTGSRGSGTVFFAWCNLRCLYCQNSEISWQGMGRESSAQELAAIMLSLQRQGCHNINFVSPSHVVAQILEALDIAAAAGLRVPLVYNTGGYDSLEALTLLDGVIDIYMPDLKYSESEKARRYSKVRDYAAVNQAAVREMHRQVGDLVLEESGLAVRGLLVRHLVLPDDLAGSDAVFRFLAEEISPETYLNVMAQYRPCYRAAAYRELDRRPTGEEIRSALAAAVRHGLHRLDGGEPARPSAARQ